MDIRIEFLKFSKEYKGIRNLKKTTHDTIPCLEFDARDGHMVFNLNNVLFYVTNED